MAYRKDIRQTSRGISEEENIRIIYEIIMDTESIVILSKLWPIFVAFILLIVTLAQAHYRIKVLEEKVKVAFELINKITDKFSK